MRVSTGTRIEKDFDSALDLGRSFPGHHARTQNLHSNLLGQGYKSSVAVDVPVIIVAQLLKIWLKMPLGFHRVLKKAIIAGDQTVGRKRSLLAIFGTKNLGINWS